MVVVISTDCSEGSGAHRSWHVVLALHRLDESLHFSVHPFLHLQDANR